MENPTFGAALGPSYTEMPAQDLVPVQVDGKHFLVPKNSTFTEKALSVVLSGEYPLTQFGRFPLGVGLALDGSVGNHYQTAAASPYAKINIDFPHGYFQVGARLGGSVFATHFRDQWNSNFGIDGAFTVDLRLSEKVKLQFLSGARGGVSQSTQFFTAVGIGWRSGKVQIPTIENPGAGISALEDTRKALDNLVNQANAQLQGFGDSNESNIEGTLMLAEDYIRWLSKRDVAWKNTVGDLPLLPPLNDVVEQLKAGIQYAKVAIPSNANRDHEIKHLTDDIDNLNLSLAIAVLKILVMNENSAFYHLQVIAKSVKAEIAKGDYEKASAIFSDYEDKLTRLHTAVHRVDNQISEDHKFVIKAYKDRVDCWYKGEMCGLGVDFSLTLRQLEQDLLKIKPAPPAEK